MRIVIDMQACQSGYPQARVKALEQAKTIAQLCSAHEIWFLLCDRFPGTIDGLRKAAEGVTPPCKVSVVHLPTTSIDGPNVWTRQATQLILENHVAELHPDVVVVLNALASHVVCTISKTARYKTLLQVVGRTGQSTHPHDEIASDALSRYQVTLLERASAVFDSDLGRVQDFVDSLERSSASSSANGVPNSPVSSSAPNRCRLAYVSPLPPVKSGIADYSAELVQELSKYYEIELVVDQLEVVNPWLEANLPVRDVQWFKQNASSFDRILYHLGNNPVHKHMFVLLESHPGVVVMHDLYLGNAIEFLDSSGYMPGEFVRALYATAGWSALLDHKKTGAAESSWKYPCSKPLLDLSHGVIVHSASSCQLADHLYGTGYSQNWQQLPVLRGNVSSLTRKAACDSLGLDDADFLVCSFGMVGLTKLNNKLLQAWLDSDLAQNPQCKLVFVGDVDLSPYGRSLVQSIEHFKSASRIEITGFVSPERYKAYLAACDCAVQLRTLTRGESSASLLDCLLHGIPTITNAHGANAEIPDGIAIKLKDQFEIADLSASLARLHRDGKLRGDLRKASKEYVEQHHAPLRIGTLYHEAIEKCMALSRHQSYQKLLTSLASIASDPGPVPEEILAAANAIGANQIKPLPRQFLVDISALVQKDLKTGIQRVVRSILNALLTEPPHGFRVMPVYSRGTGDGYRYAAQFMRESFGLLSPELDDAPIEADSGDVFLGLDLFTHGTFVNRLRLQELKNLGIQVYFVVYDILPLLRPECFPEDASSDFRDWLETVATVSNGLICISRAVSNELHHWLTSNPVQRLRPLNIGFFHLGADIDASAPTIGLPADASEMLSRVAARQSFLAVGTVEPRKGHAQTLSAMELLWEKGIDVNYVIVGSHGWLVDEMAVRISNHPEWGIRLFWLQGASDEMLARVYIASTVLLAASEGEGFGLPLIEAARQGLPVLARNLPVFREVMGASASYFDASSPHELAEALERWLNLSVAGNAPQSHALEWLTWSQSAKQLVGALQNASWNHTVPTML